jgi:hypothetical protein
VFTAKASISPARQVLISNIRHHSPTRGGRPFGEVVLRGVRKRFSGAGDRRGLWAADDGLPSQALASEITSLIYPMQRPTVWVRDADPHLKAAIPSTRRRGLTRRPVGGARPQREWACGPPPLRQARRPGVHPAAPLQLQRGDARADRIDSGAQWPPRSGTHFANGCSWRMTGSMVTNR